MSFKKKQTPKEIEETVINHVSEQIRKRLKLLLDAYYWKCENIGDALWLCHNLDVPHRLQSGFNCGLVALRMAAEFLLPSSLLAQQEERASLPSYSPLSLISSRPISTSFGESEQDGEVYVTSLLLLAQRLQFTNEGEIFSSDDLAVLGGRHYGLRVEVLRSFSSSDVLNHLLSGYPFLIPYDADKNFAPCIANGHRPHWALVRGFIYKLPQETSGSLVHTHFSAKAEFIETDKDRASWFHTTAHLDDAHLYLICQHGKSRNLVLWNFAVLAESNSSLSIPDEERRASGRWRIPADLAALRGSIVLVFPPK